MKAFVFNHDRCNGCRNCQFACKDEHCNNDWSPYAKQQPDVGHFWINVDEKTRGTVPKVKVSYIVKMCQHCENAPCMDAAPEAVYRRDDGLVIIDPEKAKGLASLVDSCPYGAIFYNAELDIPQKCTGCAHLIDDGWDVPHCVDCCPTGALRFGDEADFAEEIAASELLIEGTDTKPRVYYLNLPKRFIGGIVVDIDADEVVIGAKVTLQNLETEEVVVTLTDDFGDYWFKQIDAAPYNLYFEKEGYMTRTISTSTVEADKNVGVTELFKTPAVLAQAL